MGISTGERDAVRIPNSGLPVDHSGPGLRVGPTLPATAGRKPEARLPIISAPVHSVENIGVKESRAAGLSQRKSGQGFGDRVPVNVEREAFALGAFPAELDPASISQMRELFELLDRWDRESNAQIM
jgi:hypothetical protein